jgi:predicted nucleic acid-binding protein
MVYKIFADTNVFLDHLLQRTSDWKFAENLFRLADEKKISVFTSSSSIVNVIYALNQQKLSKADIIKICTYILSYIRLADITEKIFLEAINSGFSDLEDAIQYYSALQIKSIDYFVTSNLKDYKKALPQLPVLSPKQFLQKTF